LLEHLVGDGVEAARQDSYTQVEQIDRVSAPKHISSFYYEIGSNVESFGEPTAKLKFGVSSESKRRRYRRERRNREQTNFA